MDLFAKSDLRRLLETEGSPCVSLYMPTHRTGREIREDALRCKNLLNQADERLQDSVRINQAREILEPARRLQADEEFWRNQSDGLAIFAAPGRFHSYRLPLSFDEGLFVRDRFHVKPLLPLLEGDGQFYLLAASLNQIRLFRGTHYSISEVTPESLPGSLREALNIDEYRQHLNFVAYRAAGGPQTGDIVMFHGQGGGGGEVKKNDEIRQFFRRLARGLEEFLGGERTPLVFAGVDYLFPIFRETISYPAVVDEPVPGNPDELKQKVLHEKAWTVIAPRFDRRRQKALDQYRQQAGTGLATSHMEMIHSAARQGAVGTLLIAHGQQVWGCVDEASGKVTEHPQREPGDEELVDLAVMHTLLNSGTVYTLQRDQMPDKVPIAAVFRHPVSLAPGPNH